MINAYSLLYEYRDAPKGSSLEQQFAEWHLSYLSEEERQKCCWTGVAIALAWISVSVYRYMVRSGSQNE
jgi:hypothetical protein